MVVSGITVDAEGDGAVLLLASESDQKLVIAIGLSEATAIAMELENVEVSRPLTHDLLKDFVTTLDGRVQRVEIVALHHNTYFAEIVLTDARGREMRVDSRPSDAVALALRCDVSIWVKPEVMARASASTESLPDPTDLEASREWLETMDPEDFGKYKM